MSKNTLKVSPVQNQSLQDEQNFDQRRFISDIYECEKQKYILEKRYNKLKKDYEHKDSKPAFYNTEFGRNANKNCKKKMHVPVKPEPEVFNFYDELKKGAILGVATGIILFILELVFANSLISIFGEDLPGIIEVLFDIVAIPLVMIIYLFIKSIKRFLHNNKRMSKYYKEKIKPEKYNKEVEKHNNEVISYWKEKYNEYCNELEKKDNEKHEFIIKPELDEVSKQLKSVNQTLEELYNLRLNGVLCLHPNYRGLVTISVLYGYFDTGRCSQLQGHEGAYNLYEDEKMKGMIINKLDVVSRQLGKLQNTMYYVGKAIEECNDRLSELQDTSARMIGTINNIGNNVSNQISGVSNQMDAIEANTANSAYYSEIGAKMATFNTIYNL